MLILYTFCSFCRRCLKSIRAVPFTTLHLIHCLKIISQSEHEVTRQSLSHRHHLREGGGSGGGDFPTGYDDNDGVVATRTHRQDSPPTPGPLPHLTLRRPTRRRRWRQLELRRRRAGARVRFARSLAASLLAVARRCRQTSWLGSERSGDKNRWNEDDLKFRSRTISRNNIAMDVSLYYYVCACGICNGIVHRPPTVQ